MRKTTTTILLILTTALLLSSPPAAIADGVEAVAEPRGGVLKTADLELRSSRVTHLANLDLLVFEQKVAGRAGATVPVPRGQLDGAPILGHVFPTTLAPTDVGFGDVEGIVALAVTSHPDFDDTPLWDEDGDRDYTNDGVVFHTHWVVLVPDGRVPGGLAARSFELESGAVLPPTNPGMPIYLDSPGFSVVLRGDTLKVLVPADRVGGRTDFRFDAVTAYMEVSTGDDPVAGDRPMLGVYEVYGVLSGDLSLPYSVTKE